MAIKTDANPSPGRISLAQEGPPQGELQLVGFHVGGEEFGLDILRVQEIIRLQELTRVPNSNESMDGVMNLRGKIIPVVALRKRFGLEQVPPNKQNRIVVVEIRGAVLGLIVDSVSEVLRLPAGTVEPPPRLSKVKQEYVSGVGKLDDRLLILLDVERLLINDDLLGTTAAQA
jgi:purine-binding chemotaxis protein CheW